MKRNNSLISINAVISKTSRDKLRVLMQKLDLPNINVGIEEAIERAYESLEKGESG